MTATVAVAAAVVSATVAVAAAVVSATVAVAATVVSAAVVSAAVAVAAPVIVFAGTHLKSFLKLALIADLQSPLWQRRTGYQELQYRNWKRDSN